jgi:hypothetical protein
MGERVTNQPLREWFRLSEENTAVMAQVIAATIEANLIKPDESVGALRTFARCSIPQADWAAVDLVFKAFPGAAIPGSASLSELQVARGL